MEKALKTQVSEKDIDVMVLKAMRHQSLAEQFVRDISNNSKGEVIKQVNGSVLKFKHICPRHPLWNRYNAVRLEAAVWRTCVNILILVFVYGSLKDALDYWGTYSSCPKTGRAFPYFVTASGMPTKSNHIWEKAKLRAVKLYANYVRGVPSLQEITTSGEQ
jgi:hypothetical protein